MPFIEIGDKLINTDHISIIDAPVTYGHSSGGYFRISFNSDRSPIPISHNDFDQLLFVYQYVRRSIDLYEPCAHEKLHYDPAGVEEPTADDIEEESKETEKWYNSPIADVRRVDGKYAPPAIGIGSYKPEQAAFDEYYRAKWDERTES